MVTGSNQEEPQAGAGGSLSEDTLSLLHATSLFVGVPEAELETILGCLQPAAFGEGETIIREGDLGDCCYIIGSGAAGVISRDLIGQQVTLAPFGPGAHFGEVALVTDGRRTATVRALEPVVAYLLRRDDFVRLEQSCPAFVARMRKYVDVLAVDTVLRKASPFAHLPDETLRRLAGQLRSERAHTGDVIIRQGDMGDRFYLVRTGRAEVLRDGRQVQVLEVGDCFGEVALLTAEKRTATVRALEATELLSLAKPEFDALVQEHAALRRQFGEFIRIRVGDALARSVATADPLSTLMPDLSGHRRKRYWWMLLAGVGLFAGLSVLAASTLSAPLVYAALIVGSFVGPVVYVTYLAESHLLPDRPLNLAITFLLAAALGIPLAIVLEGWLGARHGALGSSFLVGVIEEAAKVVGVTWLLRRSTSRFQMDGVVYGAAAGMGFAAFENILYGLQQAQAVRSLLSTLWLRSLLSPFGHGTWTAIICGAIWRQKGSGRPFWDLGTFGAFALSVGLHTLWDWQPVQGMLLIVWLLLVGVVGLVALREMLDRASQEALEAVVALNPEVANMNAEAFQSTCRVCGQASPPGTHYCVRCGAALRGHSA